ncbi:hypothetical protein IJU85_01790 [Candidatus Saccharibacteria bacterium]|jgi:hypothetical protein|nr:hypothetical protein [Candidatus Saccharibacteria bacterium]
MNFLMDVILPMVVGAISGLFYAYFFAKIIEKCTFIPALFLSVVVVIIAVAPLALVTIGAERVTLRVLLYILCMCLTREAYLILKLPRHF